MLDGVVTGAVTPDSMAQVLEEWLCGKKGNAHLYYLCCSLGVEKPFPFSLMAAPCSAFAILIGIRAVNWFPCNTNKINTPEEMEACRDLVTIIWCTVVFIRHCGYTQLGWAGMGLGGFPASFPATENDAIITNDLNKEAPHCSIAATVNSLLVIYYMKYEHFECSNPEAYEKNSLGLRGVIKVAPLTCQIMEQKTRCGRQMQTFERKS